MTRHVCAPRKFMSHQGGFSVSTMRN
jgi:hypothetical protein